MVGAKRVSFARPKESNGISARFATALAEALQNNGIALADDAELVADTSIAQSDALSGIVRGEGAQAASAENQDWLVEPRERGRFDKCSAQRLRATFVLYSRTTGSVVYRGSGEAVECDFGDTDLDIFAQALVADALKPSGR